MSNEPTATVAPARIVVGVDGSPSSRKALRWAAALAPALDATVEAVIAWEYPTSYGWATMLPPDWRPDLDAAKVVEATVDDVFKARRPDGLVTSVVEGHPTTVLLAASRSATMLVVGCRGHGGFTGMLLGSVSRALAEHADCPVMVVHGDGPSAVNTA